MARNDPAEEKGAERAALRRALSESEARLATNTWRDPGAHRRFEPLVERLRTSAAAVLQPESERRLACHVDADDSFARDRIAHALAGACGSAALPALLRAPSPEVRCAAVEALGSSHDEVVADLLVARADDIDPRVRFSAAWAPARRPGPAVRAALERLAADEDADVRDAARAVLELVPRSV